MSSHMQAETRTEQPTCARTNDGTSRASCFTKVSGVAQVAVLQMSFRGTPARKAMGVATALVDCAQIGPGSGSFPSR